MNKLETREQAEARALELWPKGDDGELSSHINLRKRQAFLQCWEEMQADKQTCGFCVEPNTDSAINMGRTLSIADDKKKYQKELLKEMMRKDEASGMYDDINEIDTASKTIKEAFDNIPKEVRDRHAKAAYEEHKQLREAAEKVVVVNHMSSIRVPIEVERAIEQLEKALR